MDHKHLSGNNKTTNPSKFTNPCDTYCVNHIKHCDREIFVKIKGTTTRSYRCRYLTGPSVYIHEPLYPSEHDEGDSDRSYVPVPNDARVMKVFGNPQFRYIGGMWWFREPNALFPVGVWPVESLFKGTTTQYVVWPTLGDQWNDTVMIPPTTVSLPPPPPPPVSTQNQKEPIVTSSTASSSSSSSTSFTATHIWLESKKHSKKDYRSSMGGLTVRNCEFYPITVQSLDTNKKETWEVVTLEFTSSYETWKFHSDHVTATLIQQERRKDTLVYLKLSDTQTLNLPDLKKHIIKQKGIYNKRATPMTLH